MGTIFDITADFNALYEMATDPDCDEQAFQDTLEALTGELEVKGKGYVSVIKQLEMEMTQANIVAEQFKLKAKVRENHIKRMKEALKMAMEAANVNSLDADPFTIKIQKNGGLQPLTILGDVPESFTKVTVEPDGEKIREYLKENTATWARLEERGTHIVIK